MRTVLLLLLLSLPVLARPERLVYPFGGRQLVVEVLTDRLLHVQLCDAPPRALPRTFALPLEHPGPTRLVRTATGCETPGMTLRVQPAGLELAVDGVTTLTLTPELTFTMPQARSLYGLGEQFHPSRVGRFDGDWKGLVRFFGVSLEAENPFGNALVKFEGGAVGNASFPILFGLGSPSCMLFLDSVSKQRWNFTDTGAYRLELADDPAPCFFLAAGADLQELRPLYMQLVGRPRVPPRKAFGMWVSEYGYDNWAELLEKLAGLRRYGFPVDGFVLDLQWFGGITSNSEHSRMGSLSFDTVNFPDPAGMLRRLRDEEGLGIIPIEEPYISQGLPEWKKLAERGFLARKAPGGGPFDVNETPWWGLGGMLDFSNPAASRYWHQLKRQPLVNLGVAGHWTDLGEPECFRHLGPGGQVSYPYYHLGGEAQVHNRYSWLWSEGIARGYAEAGERRRPFILSRSGGPGIQRFGTCMWSGDIGANARSLATHYNVQMHMALSGIDYFGSDVGGFHRIAHKGTPAEYAELYTYWFADACATDVPLRPHAQNADPPNIYETSPDRVGERDSNLANLRLRYGLIPYYYSLAHRAARTGHPVVAPPAYYHPEMPALGALKMIGPDLLVALALPGQTSLNVTLPPGDWVDLRRHGRYRGEAVLPLRPKSRLELPYLVRAGAVIPLMEVDEKTRNSTPERNDLLVFATTGPRGQFLLVEDDGESVSPAKAETLLSQETQNRRTTVTVGGTSGTWLGAPAKRPGRLTLALPAGAKATRATLQGVPVRFTQQGDAVNVAWGGLPVAEPKVLTIDWQ